MKLPAKFKEYIWLVNTIRRAHRITLAEINEKWIETDMSGGVELARSTFVRHKDAIEDIFGIFIDCDRQNGYKYFIGNEEVLRGESVQNWMLSTLSVSNVVSESLSLQKRILLPDTPYQGELLEKLIEAMKRSVKVSISYRRYGHSEMSTVDFEPYCIKLFKQRWYVLAHFHRLASADKEEASYFVVYSFDRILDLQLTDKKFTVDPDFDADEFFSDSYGVVVNDDTNLERLVLRVYDNQRFYLRDLPLHHSQREVATTAHYSDFELYLRPTIDFTAHLMSLSNFVKVLSPRWLAEEIREMHRQSAALYDEDEE